MKKFSCPSCGGELVFQSSISIFCVCSYCGSTVVRNDLNVESLGKMSEMPIDVSPFQIGTRGKYQSQNFQLIGRLKLSWTDGVWNEWFAHFGDNKQGWLAEAQGFYMMSFRCPIPAKLPSQENILVGQRIELTQSKFFKVSDIKEATYIASEGELPFLAPQNKKKLSIDFSTATEDFATLEFQEKEKLPYLYVGKYVDFDDLKFSELRRVDGW